MPAHQRHEVEARLARIEGHLHAVHRMAHEGKPYPDIVHQVVAVRASLDAVLKVIVDDLAEAFTHATAPDGALRSSIDELRAVMAQAL
ncbi:MAG: metal-sensitive transcriptional regulator [Thermoplasmata archaeon]|nr:metal-sensitive transcriptional regulator [Thermoplasmata archaeon]